MVRVSIIRYNISKAVKVDRGVVEYYPPVKVSKIIRGDEDEYTAMVDDGIDIFVITRRGSVYYIYVVMPDHVPIYVVYSVDTDDEYVYEYDYLKVVVRP